MRLRGQYLLRSLHFAAQLRDGTLVCRRVPARLLLPQLQEVLHNALVEVLPAKVRVAVRRNHLEDPVVDGQNAHIKGAAPEVEHQDVLLRLLVQPVGNRGRRGLVDDPLDLQPSNGAGVLGRLTLGVIEIRRASDDRPPDRNPKVRFRSFLHLNEDHSGDLFRGVKFLLSVEGELDGGGALLVDNVVRKELAIPLEVGVVPATPDEPLDIK
uniref:Uncharacterized protein n=1 Tax=Arcella intermedia TaxID=1963864 RepID=A0A6B2LDX3_9EUKA